MRSTLTLGIVVGSAALAASIAGCDGPTAREREGHTTSAQSTCELDAEGIPTELRCAGLYTDWATHAVDPAARPFTPGFALFSDGAEKSRWIVLPPGTTIDASDMNGWVFPVGTKLFKEFRLTIDGRARPVETRMLWKREDGWAAVKYVWSEVEDTAVRTSDAVRPLPEKSEYEAPSEGTCGMCHRGAKDQVLGFSAVLLASPKATGLTYAALREQRLLGASETPEPASLQIPGDDVAVEALGRLHVGCGVSCHAGGPRIRMRLDVTGGHTPARLEDTALYKTGVSRGPGFGAAPHRIVPGDEEQSALYLRMSSLDYGKMPPIVTQTKDEAGLAAVRAFIRALPH